MCHVYPSFVFIHLNFYMVSTDAPKDYLSLILSMRVTQNNFLNLYADVFI